MSSKHSTFWWLLNLNWALSVIFFMSKRTFRTRKVLLGQPRERSPLRWRNLKVFIVELCGLCKLRTSISSCALNPKSHLNIFETTKQKVWIPICTHVMRASYVLQNANVKLQNISLLCKPHWKILQEQYSLKVLTLHLHVILNSMYINAKGKIEQNK